MPERDPTKGSADAFDKASADVAAALEALEEPPEDNEVLEAKLLRAAISGMRNFYSTFFSEVYKTQVEGFGWEDKRTAVRAILEHEGDESALGQTRYELATLFEDLSDELHGDVDFGYADDLDLLREFAREHLETWKDLVLAWLHEAEPAVAAELRQRFEEDEEDAPLE